MNHVTSIFSLCPVPLHIIQSIIDPYKHRESLFSGTKHCTASPFWLSPCDSISVHHYEYPAPIQVWWASCTLPRVHHFLIALHGWIASLLFSLFPFFCMSLQAFPFLSLFMVLSFYSFPDSLFSSFLSKHPGHLLYWVPCITHSNPTLLSSTLGIKISSPLSCLSLSDTLHLTTSNLGNYKRFECVYTSPTQRLLTSLLGLNTSLLSSLPVFVFLHLTTSTVGLYKHPQTRVLPTNPTVVTFVL